MRGAPWLCVAAVAALCGGAAGRAPPSSSQTVDGVPIAEIERSGRYPLNEEGRDALRSLLTVIRAGTTREKFIADLDAAVARAQEVDDDDLASSKPRQSGCNRTLTALHQESLMLEHALTPGLTAAGLAQPISRLEGLLASLTSSLNTTMDRLEARRKANDDLRTRHEQSRTQHEARKRQLRLTIDARRHALQAARRIEDAIRQLGQRGGQRPADVSEAADQVFLELSQLLQREEDRDEIRRARVMLRSGTSEQHVLELVELVARLCAKVRESKEGFEQQLASLKSKWEPMFRAEAVRLLAGERDEAELARKLDRLRAEHRATRTALRVLKLPEDQRARAMAKHREAEQRARARCDGVMEDYAGRTKARLGLVARIKRLKQKLKDGDSLPSAMFTLQGYVGQEDAR